MSSTKFHIGWQNIKTPKKKGISRLSFVSLDAAMLRARDLNHAWGNYNIYDVVMVGIDWAATDKDQSTENQLDFVGNNH